jgi:hypothetical protein
MATQGDERDGGPRRGDPRENSVLFSLDQLRAMAQREGEAPRPEVSQVPAHFCGAQLSGIATKAAERPMVLGPALAPALVPPRQTSGTRERLLTRAVGLLLLTAIGMGGYIVVDPRPRSVVTRIPAPEPMEAAVSMESDDVELVPDASTSAGTEVTPAQPPAQLAGRSPSAEPVGTVKRRSAAGPRARSQPNRPQVAERPPTAPSAEVLPLQCVLEPGRAGCAGPSATVREPPPRADPPQDPLLPETLSQSALRDGIATVKASAKQCAGRHGGSAGEKVKIRLSIVGATGAVQLTAAEGEYRGTALGNCVAAALKKASFPRFRKPVIGLEYTITL